MRSDSERDISVGGVQLVPTSVFAGVVLHRPRATSTGPRACRDEVRYSGSPLAYSFSEAGRTKGGWLLELGPDGLERADFVAGSGPPPGWRRLRGGIEDLLADAAHAAPRTRGWRSP